MEKIKSILHNWNQKNSKFIFTVGIGHWNFWAPEHLEHLKEIKLEHLEPLG